jgi:hypothetical protein
MIFTLHTTNTVTITSVATISAFSKEANFMQFSFLTPRSAYAIRRHHA